MGGGIDEALKEWATPRQLEYIDAIKVHGSMRKAAVACNVTKNAVNESIKSLKNRAALKGYSPDHDYTKPVPTPYIVKGVSTYYGKDGTISGQWVKSALDQQRLLEMLQIAVAAMNEDINPVAPIVAPDKELNDKLCTLITLTDCHIGMKTWKMETGEPWDLEISETMLIGAFKHLIRAAPPAKTCIINQLGDFLHQDGLDAVTPTARNQLDSDSRFPNVVATAVRILRAVVAEALATHEIVHLVLAEGNHDIASSVWLRCMFGVLYENEPRVIVNQSELPYYAIQHGVCLIGMHHSHLAKQDRLPAIFAQEFRAMWGATTKAYIHSGHMHSAQESETSGCKVIQHATIASRDSYAARHGWASDRQIIAITYHSDFGEIVRSTVCPEMLA